MADVYQMFAVDLDREVKGARVKIADDLTFLIARYYNDNHTRVMQEKYTRVKDAGIEITEEMDLTLAGEAMAETILLGWEGELKIKGEVIEYSVEAAKKLLNDKELKELRKKIVAEAQKLEHYKASWEAEDKEAL